MVHLLFIDDDPRLLPKKVRHVFPAPAYRVVVADTSRMGVLGASQSAGCACLNDRIKIGRTNAQKLFKL
jgi:hypothetical protein